MPRWAELRGLFDAAIPGVRQIFLIQVNRVQTSCGFGVPLLELVGQREDLANWSRKKGPGGIVEYRARNNRHSIDGLPSPTVAPQDN